LWINIRNDEEPWSKGDPEIYVLVGQVANGVPITHKIYLPWVNDEKRWYWLGDHAPAILYFYYNSSYSPLTYFHFYEEDDGDPIPISIGVSTPWGGVSLGFEILDGDDGLGAVWVNRDELPWVGSKRYSTGKVWFEVDKDW
jgi:hypothetical protein